MKKKTNIFCYQTKNLNAENLIILFSSYERTKKGSNLKTRHLIYKLDKAKFVGVIFTAISLKKRLSSYL